MNRIHRLQLSLFFVTLACGVGLAQEPSDSTRLKQQSFSTMAWNIWHGGKEDGEKEGPQRVVEVIRSSGADIVAMQETYGSGESISEALKFHFHPRGSNVSVHSRFPIAEDISVFEEFKVAGALIDLPNKQQIAFYSIWLPYNKEIWEKGTRDISEPNSLQQACQASCDDLIKIRDLITQRLSDKKYAGVPVIIAGDFNSMSHLDYRPCFKNQFEIAMDWNTSQVLPSVGFRDSYRELTPEVNRMIDRTWSPRFPDQQQDRIDYIYYRGDALIATESKIIDSHAKKFPSDHAALVTQFLLAPNQATEQKLRVASYNIKHGSGNDGILNLERTSALLDNLDADIIGLQEVDNKTARSGGIDQANFIAKRTKMKSAFGSFMSYDGGEYGLAVLSKFPIVDRKVIRLPDGNEPRVALACEIELPRGDRIVAVNVHFDWVRDDTFRFQQAKTVAAYLKSLEKPYVLLGDFNDVRTSRTVELLSADSVEAKKPANDRFTFSSMKPETEIDFLFASPPTNWQTNFCRVLDGRITSDHRPVVSVFTFKTTEQQRRGSPSHASDSSDD